MVTHRPAGSDWPGRILLLFISAVPGLFSAAIVFYFSSKAAEIETLRAQVGANSQAIAVIQANMVTGKANRDRQIDEINARLERRR